MKYLALRKHYERTHLSTVQFLVLKFKFILKCFEIKLFNSPLWWQPGTFGHWTHNSGPELRTLNPGSWVLKFVIELQNKTLKGKISPARKRDNAKYPFIYFSLIKIVGFFFLEWSFICEFFRKIMGIIIVCLSDFSRRIALHSTRSSLRKRWGEVNFL